MPLRATLAVAQHEITVAFGDGLALTGRLFGVSFSRES
jgi:hypothetical protein